MSRWNLRVASTAVFLTGMRAPTARRNPVLTLDGVFVTFVGTSLASKASELSRTVSAFGPETWVLLGAALVCLVLSCSAVSFAWSPVTVAMKSSP
jgi:hypothetical protein